MNYKIEDNPFRQIYVDLTYDCNMKCNICYNKNRNGKNISLDYFEKVCKKFQNKVVFRFLGGEPTLHPNLFELIKIAKKYNHFVSLITNGKKFVNYDYAKQLKKIYDPSFIIAISFEGGINNNEVYQIVNNEDCSKWKMKALDNLYKAGFDRVAINSIIIKDLNEFVIKDLLKLYNKYKPMIKHIHLRTMAKIGNYIKTKPYTIEEIKNLLRPYLPELDNPYKSYSICKEPCGGCNRFWISKDLEIGLISFANEKSINCKIRGKLLNNFTIVPWFEEMKNNG